MKKELKREIKTAFDAPLPRQKQEFLRALNYPKMSRREFLYSQLGYIRKKVWAISVLLFLTALMTESFPYQGTLDIAWAVSALVPFLTLVTVTEITRSAVFGMAEIEMSARYSLHSVLLARMGILGTGNLILLLAIIPFLSVNVNMGLLKTGVILIVPYLLTCFLSFLLINRFRSGEVNYYCAGAAIAVSGFEFLFNQRLSLLSEQQYYALWLAAVVVLSIVVYREVHKFMINTEELTWNLYLTD